MRRRRKPPSKAKQIRQLQQKCDSHMSVINAQTRTFEFQQKRIQELHEENESIKQDFKTCKAWSNLEVCIQHESSLRVFRASIDIAERYITCAHRILSPHILGNPLRTDRAKYDACREIHKVAEDLSNIMRRKIADSMLDYFSDTDRQLNDGRIY